MEIEGDDIPVADLLHKDDTDAQQVIQVLEEFASIERTLVETGKVLITKSVAEKTTTVNIPIVNESYQLKHVPGSQRLMDAPPQPIKIDGDTTIISVIREVSVVIKKYQLIEEIHLTRHITQMPLTQDIILRKESVKVERTQL